MSACGDDKKDNTTANFNMADFVGRGRWWQMDGTWRMDSLGFDAQGYPADLWVISRVSPWLGDTGVTEEGNNVMNAYFTWFAANDAGTYSRGDVVWQNHANWERKDVPGLDPTTRDRILINMRISDTTSPFQTANSVNEWTYITISKRSDGLPAVIAEGTVGNPAGDPPDNPWWAGGTHAYYSTCSADDADVHLIGGDSTRAFCSPGLCEVAVPAGQTQPGTYPLCDLSRYQ
jgi:hypothetical protein